MTVGVDVVQTAGTAVANPSRSHIKHPFRSIEYVVNRETPARTCLAVRTQPSRIHFPVLERSYGCNCLLIL